MRKTSLWVGIVLGIILMVSSPVSAKEDVPGVTDTEVVVGWTTPLSGPAALWGVTGLGAKAWADHINDQGGIYGRKIKMILMDDGYNPTRAMANLQKMKGKIFALSRLLDTAALQATKQFFY